MTSATNIWRMENLNRASNVTLKDYDCDLQFYTTEVLGTLNFEDLKKLAVARVSILGVVCKIATRHESRKPANCLDELVAVSRGRGLDTFADLFDVDSRLVQNERRRWARWMDHVSHNAVCLALSQTNDTRQWLQRAEDLLFEWRLTALSDKEIAAFIRSRNMELPALDEDKKMRLKYELSKTMEEPEKFNETIFYEVPYKEALDLVAQRKVHLASGTAYVTLPLLRSVICYRFSCSLKKKMQLFNGSLCRNDDLRVHDLIRHVRKVQSSMNSSSWKGRGLGVEGLDMLAAIAYPPCMRKLHEALRSNHHLRNQGRVQYTLFLKSIGVVAEAAIDFYRKEFTKKITAKAFNKEYEYYIRHLYGLVGSKKDYKLNDCSTIGRDSVGNDEYHGCPFTLGDMEDLDKMLTRWKIPSTNKRKIYQLTREKKYSEACSAYYEAKHGCCTGCPIVNPIDFYRQSRQVGDFRRNLRTRANAYENLKESDD